MNRDGLTKNETGITLVELLISLAVLAMVTVGVFSLFVNLSNSLYVSKSRSIATTLATNQMEYLKGLSYDSLAVAGGSIYTTNPLPASSVKTLNGIGYKIVTSVNYVDDAYDGCANYPSQALKQKYCRNYPPPSGSPSVDTNPGDYKGVHVSVYNNTSNQLLAEVDSQVAARVAETSSTTGALLVSVIDENGNPVQGATVSVSNTVIVPAANLSDSSDSNGVSIFYGLPPNTGNNYTVTATAPGYSTLSTIKPSGSLQPVYLSQNIVTQQSSSVTLTLHRQGSNSLVAEAVDINGNPISGLKLSLKGGYKKYTVTSDTQYYYNNFTPDTRPTTDGGGLTAFSNLVPGDYYFCGDNAATSCSVGGTNYYLVSALQYTGDGIFSPTTVPTFNPASPPATTFNYAGAEYLQKVRLVFSASSSFPRVIKFSPATLSLTSSPVSSFTFQVTGDNLSGSSIKLQQGASQYIASCSGSNILRNCTVDLAGVTTGRLQTIISSGAQSYTTPVAPPNGGINVTP